MACGCEGTKCKLEPGDGRHGVTGGYTTRGCRCDACRGAMREYQKGYHESNREARLAYKRIYRKTNREAVRAGQKAYCEANPDVFRAIDARRRARKANAFIGPAFTRQQVWDRDGGTCHICGKPADPKDWHLEHVIPLARGGAHSLDNCAVSHPACNFSKGARLLDELELHI